MMYVWAILLILTNVVWLLLTLMALPGNWLMVVGAAVLAWVYWDEGMFSPWTLLAVLLLAIAGEVLESITSAYGVKKVGGTKRGGWGSILGSILGALVGGVLIPIPIVGSLIGACLGAAIGAWGFELSGGMKKPQARKAGFAAGVGRLVGTVIKFAIGVVIFVIVAVAAFWP